MKKILRSIKKHLKEIVLVFLGIILGNILFRKTKESDLSKKIEKRIEKVDEWSEIERQNFRQALERINRIADEEKRMEEKLKLWKFLNG